MKIFCHSTSHSKAQSLYGEAKLDFDTRNKSRFQAVLDNGETVGIHVPRGRVLRGGDLLSTEQGDAVIRIAASEESVSTACCSDGLTLARVCYHLGNRHVPLQITASFARYQHDHVLDDMLAQMGIDVLKEYAPFEPEAGAYSHGAGSHQHAHEHHHTDHPDS